MREEIKSYEQIERIVKSAEPESESLDYKAFTNIEDISKAICAIANRKGGVILIGVNAPDLVPEEITGWTPPKSFDTGLHHHISAKTKPSNALNGLAVSHIQIPSRPQLSVTVVKIPDTKEAVWYRGDDDSDCLFLRRGSSTIKARTREEYQDIIFPKLSKGLELAELEVDNGNIEEGRRIYSNLLSTNSLDARAWLGKARCDALLYDAESALKAVEKAKEIDSNLARQSLIEIMGELEQLWWDLEVGHYAVWDFEKDGFIDDEQSDIVPESDEEINDLCDTINEMTDGLCKIFPDGVECTYYVGWRYQREGDLDKAMLEYRGGLDKVEKGSQLERAIQLKWVEALFEKLGREARPTKILLGALLVIINIVDWLYVFIVPSSLNVIVAINISFLTIIAGLLLARTDLVGLRLRRMTSKGNPEGAQKIESGAQRRP